ncbi:hypothetical protein GCM10020367_21200 [Streptomyces sannanensis]|uniref:Uncharacterized protein n=1 Tax=Streptomyces sannanensis TaxID=285536 RepID=A0ABP6S961_9ACTN
MDGPTLWALAFIGFISLVCVMGTKLASDVEHFIAAWIAVIQRLRDLLRRDHDREGDEEDEEDADRDR